MNSGPTDSVRQRSKVAYQLDALKTLRSMPSARQTIWLEKGMSWVVADSGKHRRSPLVSDAAIQFCLTFKNLFGMTLCQISGFACPNYPVSGDFSLCLASA
jgi:hypothetical protein